MKRIINTLFLLFFISTSLLSQKLTSEMHFAPGIEFFRGKSYHQSSPVFSFQFNYQLLFKRSGFNVSFELLPKDISLKNTNNNQSITLSGSRLLLYYVARLGPDSSKFSIDIRFGLGKLFKSQNYHFKDPLHVLNAVVPGLCFSTGVKGKYMATDRLGLFLDLRLTLVPYSYYYDDAFGNSGDKSDYLTDIGLNAGISFLLSKL